MKWQSWKWRLQCHWREWRRNKPHQDRWLRMRPRMMQRKPKVKVHNEILNTAIEANHRRYLSHGTLYADLSFLDPKNLPLIRTSALPESALEDLSKWLVKFDSRVKVDNQQSELKSLSGQWRKDLMERKRTWILKQKLWVLKKCPLCCFQILQRFNMLIGPSYRQWSELKHPMTPINQNSATSQMETPF